MFHGPNAGRLLEAWSQPSGGHRTVTVSWWPSSKIPQHWFVTCDLHSVWFCIVVAKCSEMGSVSVSIYQKIPTGCGAGRLMGSSQPRAWKAHEIFAFARFRLRRARFACFQKPSRWLCVRLWRSSCMHRFSKSLSNNGRVRASRNCLVSSTWHCQDVAKDQSSSARSWAFFLASSYWAAVLANKILSLPTSRAFCVWSFWRMFLLIGGEQEEAPKNIREACEPLLLPSYETARDAGL